MTLEEFVNRIPPKLCRFLARKGRGHVAMSNADIAKASGLACSTVAKISHLPNWDHVKLTTIARFMRACGINPCSFRSQRRYLRRQRFHYIARCNPAQRPMYARILDELGV